MVALSIMTHHAHFLCLAALTHHLSWHAFAICRFLCHFFRGPSLQGKLTMVNLAMTDWQYSNFIILVTCFKLTKSYGKISQNTFTFVIKGSASMWRELEINIASTVDKSSKLACKTDKRAKEKRKLKLTVCGDLRWKENNNFPYCNAQRKWRTGEVAP